MDKLIGKTFDFYGVWNESFKLDDTIYTAMEDEDDGYRSYLDMIVEDNLPGAVFIDQPLARIIVREARYENFVGYHLIDAETGHCWLKIGTDDFDDYYPCFVFNYRPMPL